MLPLQEIRASKAHDRGQSAPKGYVVSYIRGAIYGAVSNFRGHVRRILHPPVCSCSVVALCACERARWRLALKVLCTQPSVRFNSNHEKMTTKHVTDLCVICITPSCKISRHPLSHNVGRKVRMRLLSETSYEGI